MDDRRRPYRVTNRHGQTFDLLLSEETQKRDYPQAVPLKVGTPETKAPTGGPSKKAATAPAGSQKK